MRTLTGRWMPALLVGLVMLLIAGGGYAVASSHSSGRGTISRSSKKGTLKVCVRRGSRMIYKSPCKRRDKRITIDERGVAGPTGPTGPTGAIGATGAAGPSGVVSASAWSGPTPSIPPTSGLVFAGPVTTVSTTADQSIFASGSVSLGTTATNAMITYIAVCIAPSSSTTPSGELDAAGSVYEAVDVGTLRETYAASQVGTPGAGTWNVGMCVNNTGPHALDNNDWSVGWAMVADTGGSTPAVRNADTRHQ